MGQATKAAAASTIMKRAEDDKRRGSRGADQSSNIAGQNV